MVEKEKVDVAVFNWGPCIVRFKISEECKNLLIDESKNNVLDFKTKLAGIIGS